MKRTEVGRVVRIIGKCTVRVEIERQFAHPVYGKIVKARTVCYAHDEDGIATVGSIVVIHEGRPMSKLKRWWVSRAIQHTDIR